MRTKIIIAGAVALLVAGAGVALVEAASNDTPPPQRQATTKEITVNPIEQSTQNPLVNPSAAGTQSGFRGYGASSPATREQPGAPQDGSITPGAGRSVGSGSGSPSASPVQNERQAHSRLSQLGYSRVEKLNQNKDGWIAIARKGQRQVTVQIDNDGSLIAER
jgi:hypothetical protein